MSQTNIQYIVDDNGKKNSVIISYRYWKSFNEKQSALENKLRVLVGLKEAFTEVKSSRQNGKKLKTLDEFLNERIR